MKTKKVRWRVSQSDIDRLSKALNPIRTHREVAVILSVSDSLVCQLENSALGKIVRAVNEYDNYGKNQPHEQIKQNEQNGESNHE
jgi:hypothetical protein